MRNYIVTIAYDEEHKFYSARTTIEDAICDKDAALIAAAAFWKKNPDIKIWFIDVLPCGKNTRFEKGFEKNRLELIDTPDNLEWRYYRGDAI